MPDAEAYKLLDVHIHRITKITGQIVNEKTEFLKRMNEHIEDLRKAHAEVLELVETLDKQGGRKS